MVYQINFLVLMVTVVSAYTLFIMAFIARAIIKPERIAGILPETRKFVRKASRVRSKKKEIIVQSRIAFLRRKMLSTTVFSALMPVASMGFVLIYLYLVFGEVGLISFGSCALPPPIEFMVEGGCYIYTIWIVFLTYVAFLPIYNRVSGVEDLKALTREAS